MNCIFRRISNCMQLPQYKNIFFTNANSCYATISTSQHSLIRLSPSFRLSRIFFIDTLTHRTYFSNSGASHKLFSSTTNRFNIRLVHTYRNNRNAVYYVTAAAIAMLGMSFAAVPLYKIFCQATGYGGATQVNIGGEKIQDMKKVEDRLITVKFTADVASNMQWNFQPQQREVAVYPGETALAFYTARNPTDSPIIGISSYNISPYDAGIYFNKIQCFCFEEQRLNPHEQVDMPVFFYIDPEFAEDPKMERVDTVTLSYTFFEAKEGFELPIPSYLRRLSS